MYWCSNFDGYSFKKFLRKHLESHWNQNILYGASINCILINKFYFVEFIWISQSVLRPKRSASGSVKHYVSAVHTIAEFTNFIKFERRNRLLWILLQFKKQQTEEWIEVQSLRTFTLVNFCLHWCFETTLDQVGAEGT